MDDHEEDREEDLEDDYAILSEPLPEEEVAIFGKKINAVPVAMVIGIVGFGLLCQVSIVWFVGDAAGFSLGLWMGIAAAIGYIVHIWWSVGIYLGMGAYAEGMAARHAMFRYIGVGVVFIIAALMGLTQLLAAFVGLMGIKAGSFLESPIRRFLRRVKASD